MLENASFLVRDLSTKTEEIVDFVFLSDKEKIRNIALKKPSRTLIMAKFDRLHTRD